MDFRTLLATVSERYPNGQEFTSSELADSLGLPKKRVSNDLVRLYHRGFLKRQRRPRRLTVWSRAPRFISCHKGYEYVYEVNKQGESYVQWMISRRNSKSQKRINSIIQLYNMQAKTEELRERVRELDGQKCQDHVPTGRLQFIDYLTDALFEERRRSETLKREIDSLTKEAFEALRKERGAQDRANQYEAAFKGFVIPTIKWLADENRALREAAADPRPISELAKRVFENGRSIGSSETFREASQSLERMYNRLCARQLPASRFSFSKQYSGLEPHWDSANTETTDKGLSKSEVEDSPEGKPG